MIKEDDLPQQDWPILLRLWLEGEGSVGGKFVLVSCWDFYLQLLLVILPSLSSWMANRTYLRHCPSPFS